MSRASHAAAPVRFIIDPSGLIVTNAHVVESAGQISASGDGGDSASVSVATPA